MRAKVRRWGKSLAIIIPADVARNQGLGDGDLVGMEITRKLPSPEELGGTVVFKTNLGTVLRGVEGG